MRVLQMCVGLMILGGVAVWAASGVPTYTLESVGGEAQGLLCAVRGGKAAQVADLNPDLTLASPWKSYCLLEVKSK